MSPPIKNTLCVLSDGEIREPTDVELLRELLCRHKPSKAPHTTKRYGVHYQADIGVDNDHTIELNLCEDALRILEPLIPIK
jgi:hypothetical protein